jgi:oxygen-independent coproporphyrinogen-3 oxidase
MGLANKITGGDRAAATGVPAADAFGVYVHVPFCAHTCEFCAFYQVEPRRGDIQRYLSAIEREFDLAEGPARCDTAFWGGGTPGLLPPRDLERLGRAQLRRFGPPAHEWTVELAPGSVKPEKLRVLRDLGVTRASLGVQSFSPRLLDALGRRHSLDQVRRAWDEIRAAGFASVNLDLIFAVPGQSDDEWRADLAEAIHLAPDHVSTYCLTFEEDTGLFVRLSEGRVSIDPERERRFYELTWAELGAAGFAQYEISNHARPGHACVHNLNTWRMHAWAGFGPSAASQQHGWRGSNPADLDRWIAGIARGERGTEDRVALTAAGLAEDALIFGLRMNDGVDLRELAARFGVGSLAPFRPALDALVRDGLAAWRDDAHAQLALTPAGRLVADAVGAELVGLGALPGVRDVS